MKLLATTIVASVVAACARPSAVEERRIGIAEHIRAFVEAALPSGTTSTGEAVVRYVDLFFFTGWTGCAHELRDAASRELCGWLLTEFRQEAPSLVVPDVLAALGATYAASRQDSLTPRRGAPGCETIFFATGTQTLVLSFDVTSDSYSPHTWLCLSVKDPRESISPNSLGPPRICPPPASN